MLLFQLLNPFLMVFLSSKFMSEFFKSTSNESLVVGYSSTTSYSPANYSTSGPYPSWSGKPESGSWPSSFSIFSMSLRSVGLLSSISTLFPSFSGSLSYVSKRWDASLSTKLESIKAWFKGQAGIASSMVNLITLISLDYLLLNTIS